MFAQGINIFGNSTIKIEALNWKPQEGKQELAYNLIANEVDVLCYGGARGGGKSELGISYSINRMLKHGNSFNGIYLRNTSVELEDIASRIQAKLSSNNIPYKFNSQKNIFRVGGAKLKMFYTEGKGLDSLQGGNINHVVLEEPQLMARLDVILDKVYSMLRTSNRDCPVKMLLLCNPLGAGTRILKRNFVDCGENNIIVNNKGKKQTFIKATVYDNPLLLENDPSYLQSLENLPAEMKKAWLEGDFNVISGSAFNISKEKDAKDFEIPRNTEIFASMDWGDRAKTVIGFYAVLHDGYREILYRFDEFVFNKSSDSEVARLLKKQIDKITSRSECLNFTGLVADPSIFNHVGGRTIADSFVVNGVVVYKANNSRKWGFLQLKSALHGDNEGKNKKFFVSASCEEFWQTVPFLVLEDGIMDVSQKPKQDDHCYDECRYALMSRSLIEEDLQRNRLLRSQLR